MKSYINYMINVKKYICIIFNSNIKYTLNILNFNIFKRYI